MHDAIYTLTVVRGPEKFVVSDDKSYRSRTWTWFRDYDSAVASLHKDTDFYFEIGYYDYCVIEQVESHSIGPHEQRWFRVDYDPNRARYDIVALTEPPEEFKHIANWSIG